ncbi:MAG: type VII toxin-antitoxin system HepT family RNase toxin [Thermodesulfobacteriota bacterium]
MNQVVLNKKVSIERCIAQTRKYYAMRGELSFKEDYLKQDAIALNVQRVCELCIDIANHLIKTKKLGLPQDSKDSFSLLQRAGLIDEAMMASLRAMVGFRNILVHQYQNLDLDIMVEIIEHRLDGLLDFANTALALSDGLA